MPVVSWCLNLLYALLLLAAAPWIAWRAWFTGRYREGFRAKFFGHAPQRKCAGPCVWIHAVSVGEVNLVATIIRRLRDERPNTAIFLSTTTKTGYDLACKKYIDCTIFYAPLDFTWAVSTALDRVRPDLLILAELEIWPNWIAAAHAREIPIAVINGRLSDRSFRGYRRLRGLLQPSFARLSVVAAQNEEYAERFLALGAKPRRFMSPARSSSTALALIAATPRRGNSPTWPGSRPTTSCFSPAARRNPKRRRRSTRIVRLATRIRGCD